MSDTFTTDDEEVSTGEPQENPNLKLLREKAKAGDEALKQVADLSRKLAVLESGVDSDSPMGKLFLKAYDGENTAEAIQAAAQEYGIPIRGAEAEVVEEQPVDSGTEVRQNLADGAPADTGESPDPYQTANEHFKTAMSAGATEEAAQAGFIASIAQAAINGDQRVIYE